MTAKLPTFKQASIPQAGQIAGGALNGWSFAILELCIETPPGKRKPRVALVTRVTPPAWPFPEFRPVKLTEADFDVLRNPGEANRRYDSERLIRSAAALAGTLKTGDQLVDVARPGRGAAC